MLTIEAPERRQWCLTRFPSVFIVEQVNAKRNSTNETQLLEKTVLPNFKFIYTF